MMHPVTAGAVGMRVTRWSLAVCPWLGLAVGLAIRASGTLYTFGMLVLPALVAKNVCREVRPVFLVAPLVGVGAALVGFVLANYYDFPPAQMSVALLALGLVGVWLLRWVVGVASRLHRHTPLTGRHTPRGGTG